jgi:hypothetical protein
VKTLVDKKIVESGDYWLAQARKGKSCDGRQVEVMLLKMAKHFDHTVSTREAALETLEKHKIFASPDYWNQRATARQVCGGDNVRAVIRNFARLAN